MADAYLTGQAPAIVALRASLILADEPTGELDSAIGQQILACFAASPTRTGRRF